MSNKLIVYTFASYSSFVAKDYEILKKHYSIKKFHFSITKKWKIPILFFKQTIFFFKLLYNKKDIIFFSRLAGYHTFIPSLLAFLFSNVKSIIVLGGTDSNYIPSVKYGNYQKLLYGFCTKWSIKLATQLLPVSRYLIEATNTYAESYPLKQGVKNLIHNFKTPFTEIHNGFDEDRFYKLDTNKRTPYSFVTIASGLEEERRRKIKGVDLIIEAAISFPQYTFTIIGSKKPNIKISNNLEFISFIENKNLPKYLNQFQFYLQLSMSEGFPNALCEAMLCGCIPIVSKVGIMPEIIGKSGYVVENRSSLSIVLNELNFSDIECKSKFSREKIKSNYSLIKRENQIINVLKSLV